MWPIQLLINQNKMKGAAHPPIHNLYMCFLQILAF
jgi:hypothetical protein